MIDLVALENGGRVIAYSDAHFGHPRNLINPGVASIWVMAGKPSAVVHPALTGVSWLWVRVVRLKN